MAINEASCFNRAQCMLEGAVEKAPSVVNALAREGVFFEPRDLILHDTYERIELAKVAFLRGVFLANGEMRRMSYHSRHLDIEFSKRGISFDVLGDLTRDQEVDAQIQALPWLAPFHRETLMLVRESDEYRRQIEARLNASCGNSVPSMDAEAFIRDFISKCGLLLIHRDGSAGKSRFVCSSCEYSCGYLYIIDLSGIDYPLGLNIAIVPYFGPRAMVARLSVALRSWDLHPIWALHQALGIYRYCPSFARLKLSCSVFARVIGAINLGV